MMAFWMFVASWATLVAQHQGDGVRAHLINGDDAISLAYSPCSGDEVAECVFYSLTCRRDEYYLLFDVYTSEATEVAMDLAKQGLPPASAEVKFGDVVSVKLSLSQIHLDHNEMDGAWMLTVGVDQPRILFGAITEPTVAYGATLTLAGHEYDLVPKGTSYHLIKFKENCQALNGHWQ